MRSNLRLLFAFVVGLSATACHETAAPLPSSTWHTPFVPSGAYIALSLTTVGTQVSGSATEYGLTTQLQGQVDVEGSWVFNQLTLTITPRSGTVQSATYSAVAVGDSVLRGTWTEGGQSISRSFYRQ